MKIPHQEQAEKCLLKEKIAFLEKQVPSLSSRVVSKEFCPEGEQAIVIKSSTALPEETGVTFDR